MIITKTSHTHFNNGIRDLETKSYLKHDLVHFVVDKVLGLYNDADPTRHSEELEQIAGIMHAVYDPAVDAVRMLEGAENMFGAQGKSVPLYMTQEFVTEVRALATNLLAKYEHLKTGESMELV